MTRMRTVVHVGAPRRESRRSASFDREMLAVGDQLLGEFEQLPILTVIGAINAARAELSGLSGELPSPEAIRDRARESLDRLVLVG